MLNYSDNISASRDQSCANKSFLTRRKYNHYKGFNMDQFLV